MFYDIYPKMFNCFYFKKKKDIHQKEILTKVTLKNKIVHKELFFLFRIYIFFIIFFRVERIRILAHTFNYFILLINFLFK